MFFISKMEREPFNTFGEVVKVEPVCVAFGCWGRATYSEGEEEYPKWCWRHRVAGSKRVVHVGKLGYCAVLSCTNLAKVWGKQDRRTRFCIRHSKTN